MSTVLDTLTTPELLNLAQQRLDTSEKGTHAYYYWRGMLVVLNKEWLTWGANWLETVLKLELDRERREAEDAHDLRIARQWDTTQPISTEWDND